jgi:flagellar protein FlbD
LERLGRRVLRRPSPAPRVADGLDGSTDAASLPIPKAGGAYRSTRHAEERRSTEAAMILVTRLSGERMALNVDLIERVEETPDTVVTMVHGTKHVIEESLDELVDLVQRFKAEVLALAGAAEGARTAGTTGDADRLEASSAADSDVGAGAPVRRHAGPPVGLVVPGTRPLGPRGAPGAQRRPSWGG